MDRPVEGLSRHIGLGERGVFRVGNVGVDPSAHEVRFGATTERIQPQTMKVLIALADRVGAVVSRDELIERCWDGRYVSDDVINRSILLLRRLAKQSGGFAIETIPKAGYRLIERQEKGAGQRPSWLLPTVLILTAAVAAGAALWFGSPPLNERPTVALRPFTSGPEPEARDMAVASGAALATMLQEGGFPPDVNWPATMEDARRDDFILTGDIRRIGDGFVALVQLRDRQTGTAMLSRRYQVTAAEAAVLPERIGAQLSSALASTLGTLVLSNRHPGSTELRADMFRHLSHIVANEDPLKAYAISRRMVDREPESALSQISLAFGTSFALGSLPRSERPGAANRGRAAAATARRLAADFGDTYAPWCFLHPATRARECEDRLRAGLAADPDAPTAGAFLSTLMLQVGRYDESFELARAALADQPFQPNRLRRVMRMEILRGNGSASAHLFDQAQKWWPAHPGIHGDRITAYALGGDIAGAERALSGVPASTGMDVASAQAVAQAWRAGSSAELRRRCLSPDANYFAQSLCIGALRKFNDRETAFHVADKLFPRLVTGSAAGDEQAWLDDPGSGIDPMLSAPAMKWLRSDPRYLALAERMGLLAYWRTGRLPDFCMRDAESVCALIRRQD